MQTRVNATRLQRQDTVKIREKRKQKEQEEAASAPLADPAIKQAQQNGDGPLVLPDFTPLTNGNRYVSCFSTTVSLSCMVTSLLLCPVALPCLSLWLYMQILPCWQPYDVVWSLDASSCQCINVKLRLQPPQVAQEGGFVPGAHGRDVLLAGDCKRWGYALHPLT